MIWARLPAAEGAGQDGCGPLAGRSLCDQIITEIYEGTNEIQRLIIARELLAEGAP